MAFVNCWVDGDLFGSGYMTVLSERVARSTSTHLMHRKNAVALLALSVDVAVVSASGALAVYGRESTRLFDSEVEIRSTLGIVGPLALVGWVALIYLVGAYRNEVFGTGAEEYKRIATATIYASALLGIGCYLTKFSLSRGFFVLLFAVGLPALLSARFVLRRALHSARRHGALAQTVLISGSPSHVDEIANVLRREPYLGYRIVGALTPATFVDEETPGGVPVLGNVDDVALAITEDVDVVFFAGGAHTSASDMRRTVWALEHHHVQIVVAPSVTDISSERIKLRPVGGLPLVLIEPPTWHDASRLGKRTFDVIGSLIILLFTSPLMLAAAAWVKLHDRGPIFFQHQRVGRDGRTFGCLKFRSMVLDADAQIAKLQAENGKNALFFKLKHDPRITRPGRFLRRFSVDELPQLFNVLRGDMSLVGPRPQVQAEVRLYDDAMKRRLHVRPGLTGLWQVSGRSDLSAEEAIRLDLYYVDNWSMLQDLAILARTFGAVIGSRGAY